MMKILRDFNLQETINLLEKALMEYNEALCLSNQGMIDNLRIRVQSILSRLPHESLYIKSKNVYFNDAFFESDLPDLLRS